MGVFEHFPYSNFHNMNLDWIIEHIKEFKAALDSLDAWKEEYEAEYQQLKELYDDIISGEFPESVQLAFTEWMQENAADIMGSMITMIFFGLTDSGYFVAYIPDGWDDIIFNTTGYDITVAGYGYGHLTLSY